MSEPIGERVASLESSHETHVRSDETFHGEVRESLSHLTAVLNKGTGALWLLSVLVAALVAMGVVPHLKVALDPKPAAAATHP